MSYDLLTPAADVSRRRSAELARGQKRSHAPAMAVVYDTTPQRCACSAPWRNGEGRCGYCGKNLREPAFSELP